jgi:hypothetical protein
MNLAKLRNTSASASFSAYDKAFLAVFNVVPMLVLTHAHESGKS